MGTDVEFESDGGGTNGYLAVPKSGAGPGVVVIQEWWGLVDHIKDVCERFAGEGFVALAPDLYHGQIAKSPDEAGKMMMALRVDEAEKDLKGAIDYLRSHKSTTAEKVGMVGFCMGGALSLYAATKNSKVGACVVFYGGHPNVKPDLSNLKSPVLGIYAERDGFVTPESVHDLEKQLRGLGKSIDAHIYPGVDHAFFNDTRPEVYNAAAANDAWQRVIRFLRTNLQ
ncbi:MAG TPA: dienelactone hydrolase family protein [Pyrinomonadaceae bacterium]|jgi:carboxymethylenebutenolidase|nr:dienelactone hydrolase family protein [Pyrinomonadaceae bacterium]